MVKSDLQHLHICPQDQINVLLQVSYTFLDILNGSNLEFCQFQ